MLQSLHHLIQTFESMDICVCFKLLKEGELDWGTSYLENQIIHEAERRGKVFEKAAQLLQ